MMNRQKIKKDFFTFDDVMHAYMQCRRHKRNALSSIEFERNFVPKLMKLTDEINAYKWRPGRYKCFPVLKPRLREIWAAPFKDRIIHHLIHNELQNEFEKHYIDQSYSCIRGRGTTKCIRDAFRGCRSITKNFTGEAFYIKLDIKSFFVSIKKDILWDIVRQRVDENCLLGELVKTVMFHDITKNPRIVHPDLLKRVPSHKSLFDNNYEKQGLPIGNLTSQFFSNIYLDGLDQYCKHDLKLKYYYRYADDILILIPDSKVANNIVSKINAWLLKNRGLKINQDKTIINRIRLGVKFLGGRLFYHYKIPSNLTFEKIKVSTNKFKRNIFSQKLFATANSYLGVGSVYDIRAFCARILDKNRLDLIYDNDGKKIFYL